MKSEDWVGFRQGCLTITAFEGLQHFGRGKAARFRFRCDCGREFSSQKSNIVGRNRRDCGCAHAKPTGTAPPGASTDPRHKVWRHMIDRCSNPKNRSFKDYGGRGIGVCDRWLIGDGERTGFECFVADLGPRPARFTIERVDGAKGYGPGNCMWLPKGDQSKNRRGVKLVRIGRRAQTIPDWCRETGVGYWTAIRRIERGWPPDRAVTEHPKNRAA